MPILCLTLYCLVVASNGAPQSGEHHFKHYYWEFLFPMLASEKKEQFLNRTDIANWLYLYLPNQSISGQKQNTSSKMTTKNLNNLWYILHVHSGY